MYICIHIYIHSYINKELSCTQSRCFVEVGVWLYKIVVMRRDWRLIRYGTEFGTVRNGKTSVNGTDFCCGTEYIRLTVRDLVAVDNLTPCV